MAPRKGSARAQHRSAATHAAVLLCRGMLDDSPHGAAMFRCALRQLAGLAADGTHPLAGVPLAQVLLDAWRAAAGSGREWLTRISMADAEIAGYLLESCLRALSVPPPEVELCHVVDGGLATLVALGTHWRAGVPYVVTEHDVYLRAELIKRAGVRPGVRAVALRFLRALTRLGYAEASVIVAPSERMRRWALHHGADCGRLRVVPPGVDPRDHPRLDEPPDHPVVAWVGPADELPLLSQAFGALRERVPDARLVLVGSGPHKALPGGVGSLPDGMRALPDGMSWSGPVPTRPTAFAPARVVTISGADEAMPYPLIEAMFSGRATVCTEHGGLAAAVGIAGMVVPPRDPGRLAGAWVSLLTDDRLRRELATSARRRARTLFSLGAMLDGFRSAYRQAAIVEPAGGEQAGGGQAGGEPQIGSGHGQPVLAELTR